MAKFTSMNRCSFFIKNNTIIKGFLSKFYTYIQMGRKKKYHTEEEKKEANRRDWKIWYDKNKETLNAQRMKKYYGSKENRS